MVKIGDKVQINVPKETGYKLRTFRVQEVYRHFAVLSDGIIRVCYSHWELEHFKRPIRGCWN